MHPTIFCLIQDNFTQESPGGPYLMILLCVMPDEVMIAKDLFLFNRMSEKYIPCTKVGKKTKLKYLKCHDTS